MNSMIPGISNIPSVGSRPLYRIGNVFSQSFDNSSITTINSETSSFKSIPHKILPNSSADYGVGLKYDTIINPIPNYLQNPYILKQRKMLHERKHIRSDKHDYINNTIC